MARGAKRKTYSRRPSKGGTKKQTLVKKVATMAQRMIMNKAETKMFPKENANTALGPDDVGYLILDIDNPVQGLDNEARTGDKIQGIALQVKYNIGSLTTSRCYFVRVVIFQARQDEFDGTNDAFLLNTANEPLTLTANSLQDIQRSLNRKQMQRVFYDKVHKIGKAGGGNTTEYIFRNKFFKFNTPRIFPSDSNDQSEERNFRILFIVRDSQSGSVAADNDVQVTVFSRYYYKDF